MCEVYWLHLREHCEPSKEGYIGVSIRVEKRIESHMKALHEGKHENIHLTHAYLLYGQKIIYSIIYEGSEKECYDKENELRPLKAIGWNISEGGSKPPSQKGVAKSDVHKRNIGKSNKGNKRPDVVEFNKTRKGKKQTKEHIEKRMKGQTGRKMKPCSEETKIKLRAAALLQWSRYRDSAGIR